MRDNAKKKDIFLDFINGYREHVHALVSLGTEQTISNIVKLMKGESSHWINQNNLIDLKFEWQHEYFAVSVCKSLLVRPGTTFEIKNRIIRERDTRRNLN